MYVSLLSQVYTRFQAVQCIPVAIMVFVASGNPRRRTKQRGPTTNGDGALTAVGAAAARNLQRRTRRWRLVVTWSEQRTYWLGSRRSLRLLGWWICFVLVRTTGYWLLYALVRWVCCAVRAVMCERDNSKKKSVRNKVLKFSQYTYLVYIFDKPVKQSSMRVQHDALSTRTGHSSSHLQPR